MTSQTSDRKLAAILSADAVDYSRLMAEELRLESDISIAKVRSEMTVTDPEFLERWLDGLREAGLKE